MYPHYWTHSNGGIIMRYSYEFKLYCIDLYHQGKWPDTPEGIKPKCFHGTIRQWVRIAETQGVEALRHPAHNKEWTPEEKLVLVSQVLAGQAIKAVAINAGINDGMLYGWVRNYKTLGYNGLINKKKGRKPGNETMKDNNSQKPRELNESEREELIRLREEVAYYKAENAVIKKEIALRHEKWAAQLKAKKQKSSKGSNKMDTN